MLGGGQQAGVTAAHPVRGPASHRSTGQAPLQWGQLSWGPGCLSPTIPILFHACPLTYFIIGGDPCSEAQGREFLITVEKQKPVWLQRAWKPLTQAPLFAFPKTPDFDIGGRCLQSGCSPVGMNAQTGQVRARGSLPPPSATPPSGPGTTETLSPLPSHLS